MDRKTTFILTVAKYGGFMMTLWVLFQSQGWQNSRLLYCFIAIFALDNIRTFYLYNADSGLVNISLFGQLLLTILFAALDGSGIASILYIIIITEGMIFYPKQLGLLVFQVSLVTFLATQLYHALQVQTWFDSIATAVLNSVLLLFAFGVSYLAKRQQDEAQRAERALQQLEKSKQEVEIAYQRLLENSKQREIVAVVEERNRMAREIHDTLAHTLTTVIVGIEAGKRLMHRDVERTLEQLSKTQEQARLGLEDVRRSVRDLRPRRLDEQGFSSALKGLSMEFSQAEDINIALEIAEDIHIPKEWELPLYRIVQECLTNSVRHGEADIITIKLSKEADTTVLLIEDNGVGCLKVNEGNGLRGIQERLAPLGGSMLYNSDSAGGFRVKVSLGGSNSDH